MNPGAFVYNERTWLLIRVAERPIQKKGSIALCFFDRNGEKKTLTFSKKDPKVDWSDSRYVIYDGHYYLSTLSHLMLAYSDDGLHFSEANDCPSRLFGMGNLESYGIEDCRISLIDETFYLTYTQVSPQGVGVGLMTTKDWKSMVRTGMAFLPTNKDCAIFEEKINHKYYCLNRPSSILIGGNYIWLSSSPDLIHWGDHCCLLKTRPGMWDSERVGAGAAPIKTQEGWLVIYHGADQTQRYCLGAVLLDLENPSEVLVRSSEPIMEPTAEYEQEGFFNNVIFTNGHVIEADKIILYYGASDQVICTATLSIQEILHSLKISKNLL
jgi:predicted GH43/DUF377 family glycosyl hydrolase